jgi:hypothetical protein
MPRCKLTIRAVDGNVHLLLTAYTKILPRAGELGVDAL